MEINKQAKYDGYIWMSDKTQPQVLNGEGYDVLSLVDGANPFVIEGQLWNAAERVSISIRNIDGKYIIKTHQVADSDLVKGNDHVTLEEYIPHFAGTKKLYFLRYWEAREDEFCEHFKALVPAKLVFIGFNHMTRKED